MNHSKLVFGLFLSAVLGGCSDPDTGDEAYRQGSLGNGAFLFQCDDSVACSRWSGAAEKFPKMIATGSTFQLRFVPNEAQGEVIDIDGSDFKNFTVQTIGTTRLSPEPAGGFAAVAPGYATVVARDAKGSIIDYAAVHIVQPNGLVVYDASYSGDDPDSVLAINIKVDEDRSYRVVGERDLEAIAGSIRVKWESADADVVQVESYSSGVVKIRAKGVGKTKLIASGGGITKEIDAEVTQ